METERKFVHDLSTPLTVLQISLKRVQDALTSGQAPDLQACLTQINRCCDQAQKLTQLVETRASELRAKTPKNGS